jgi:hypothetical protein
MIPESIWAAIEGSIFASELGVVSTPRALDQALAQHPTSLALLAGMTESKDVSALSGRLMWLLKEPSDTRFCHAHDVAIAAYLRTLELRAPEVARSFAKSILAIPNLWWGKAVAKRIANTTVQTTPNIVVTYTIPHHGFVRASVRRSEAKTTAPSYSVPGQLAGKMISRTNSGSLSNRPFGVHSTAYDARAA